MAKSNVNASEPRTDYIHYFDPFHLHFYVFDLLKMYIKIDTLKPPRKN